MCLTGVLEWEQDEKLYPHSKLTGGQSLLMVMAHSLRHHSSKEGTESLLQLLDAHLPEGVTIPVIKYFFYHNFSGHTALTQLHAYCTMCKAYLCEVKKVNAENDSSGCCSQCGKTYIFEDLLKAGSFFVMLGLDSQLSDLLVQHGLPPKV